MSNVKKFNENWADEDDKDIIGKEDRDFVACGSEDWEESPVFDKMKEKDDSLTKDELEKAFQECCAETDAPHPREEFEACMIKKLGLD